MKRLLLLFSMIFLLGKMGFSQKNEPFNYENKWDTVEKYQKDELANIALKVVDEIYKKAKLENRSDQSIKSILYKIGLRYYSDDSYESTFDMLNEEIKTAGEPQKQILHSIKAELLWLYFNENRYDIRNRSTTTNHQSEGFLTLDERTFIYEIIKEYSLSIEKEELLQNTSMKDYDVILTNRNSGNEFPSVYDFLADRYLNFLTAQIIKEDPFDLNNPLYYSSASEFVNLEISSKDSISLKYLALKQFQKSIKLHLKDTIPDQLINLDLNRLDFINSNYMHGSNDEQFLLALERLRQQFDKIKQSAKVCEKIALHHFNKASSYDSLLMPQYKNYYVKSMDNISEALKKDFNPVCNNNCNYFKYEIQKPEYSINTELNIQPQKPILALLTYRNIKKLYFRIVPLNTPELENYIDTYKGEDILSGITSLKYSEEFEIELPPVTDFQKRSAEIKIPALKSGKYLLLACCNKEFDYLKHSNHPISYNNLNVGKIDIISQTLANQDIELIVLDRTSGNPIKNATVSVFSSKYNRKNQVYDKPKLLIKKTLNKNGKILIPAEINKDGRRYLSCEINYEGEVFIPSINISQYSHDTTVNEELETFLYTDRGIYRPGQTVYFKGIMVNIKGTDKKLIANRKATINLQGPNSDILSTLDLTTNEFGSFHGSFIIPNNGITGNMEINCDGGMVSFSVEEYKRPKFEVLPNPVFGNYRLNDKVTVTGIAKAFSGNPVNGAMVKYKIVRNTFYPYSSWLEDDYSDKHGVKIASGETTTDLNGAYSIDFYAAAPAFSGLEDSPLLFFDVRIDVTDMNGETHSVSDFVKVGYLSTEITLNMPNEIDQSLAPEKYNLQTVNLNDEPVKGLIEVKVYQLEQPKEMYNTRLWDKPTSYFYNESQFRQFFPSDQYYDELNQIYWPKKRLVYNAIHNTAKDTVLFFKNLSDWEGGNYKIEISGKDTFGLPITKTEFFDVMDSKTTKNKVYTPLKLWIDNPVVYPENTVTISIESSFKDANVLIDIMDQGKIIHEQWFPVNKCTGKLKFKVPENVKGPLIVNALMIKNNRTYSKSSSIEIKRKNESLSIQFATFRNKLTPGEGEEWNITIKGCDGEKIASELLTTMYDASLDQFNSNDWSLSFYENYYNRPWDRYLTSNNDKSANLNYSINPHFFNITPNKELNWFNFNINEMYYSRNTTLLNIVDNSVAVDNDLSVKCEEEVDVDLKSYGSVTYGWGFGSGSGAGNGPGSGISYGKGPDFSLSTKSPFTISNKPIQIRSNFNETAFFMPQLATDKDGNVVIKFKVPESLTRWKIMGLAHTKDLRIGQFTKELVTQKELMVVPNQPRFFREGDQMEFNAKISNISEKDLSGIAKIEFFDALTMKPINSELGLTTLEIPFSTLKGQSTSVAWKITIPQGLMAITYRVTAQAGNFSDGEEMTIPVLTNRMLVTESLPLPINGNQTKTFSFDKLKNNTSTTLKNFKYTLEFTSNPAWYAIQALPYLMEYPYECSEQTFNRFYANSIASHIANSSPKIKAVFESWKINSPEALMSNLEKNQELKSLMLEETPWVLDAKSETEQKKRIGLLFDIINMSSQQKTILNKLFEKQLESGGWSWFPGMDEDRYITLYIISGFGHLKTLEAFDFDSNPITVDALNNAINHIDFLMNQEYRTLKKSNDKFYKEYHLSDFIIQYLYARSFFTNEVDVNAYYKEAFNFYLNQSEEYWLKKSLYLQGMIAMAHFRNGNEETAKKIMASIKDRAIYSEEMGMYWRNEGGGYYWYEAPIERQALLIEAFDLITNDQESVEKMKIWLLKQKQTQNWGTTKSTAEACYALLLKGTSQLADDQLVEIKIGDKVIDPKKMDNVKVEAGTSYFKTAWNGSEITPNMSNITVTKSTAGVAWGSVYWQYFENLDKITPAATPLNMKKELFIVRATPAGEVIEPVKAGDKIKVGDKIRVRIVLRSDRDMEYVHMKDMRAAAFEPINVLSQYKYQDGLGYYESTRDAATNFFFDYLRKGTYVFEYTMFATQKGDFSNGITTIQCMYAPEFSSHSEGVRVVVE